MGASSLSAGPRWASLPRQFRFLVVLCVLGVVIWFLLNALERKASRVHDTANTLMLNQLRSVLVVKAAEVRRRATKGNVRAACCGKGRGALGFRANRYSGGRSARSFFSPASR